VLLGNAGVYRLRRRETVDGFEETFAVNHLAPFLLINLLLDRLKEGAPSRVVVTASDAHQGARLDFDDLMLRRGYGSWRAYSRSKLANVMFTYALARRLEGTGITANSHHPGFVASNLGSGNGIPVKPFMAMLRPFVLSPAEGSRTAVYLASSSAVEGVSGKYFTNSKIEARANREHRSNAFSRDEDAQERLWRESAALVGL
jgi:retinol dehydrogenase 14